jgi:hypothetical protein
VLRNTGCVGSTYDCAMSLPLVAQQAAALARAIRMAATYFTPGAYKFTMTSVFSPLSDSRRVP